MTRSLIVTWIASKRTEGTAVLLLQIFFTCSHSSYHPSTVKYFTFSSSWAGFALYEPSYCLFTDPSGQSYCVVFGCCFRRNFDTIFTRICLHFHIRSLCLWLISSCNFAANSRDDRGGWVRDSFYVVCVELSDIGGDELQTASWWAGT